MKYLFVFLTGLYCTESAYAQETTFIKDLSAFKEPAKTWRVAGAVSADLEKPNVLQANPGSGILVNQPDKKNKGADLFTSAEFGDMDLVSGNNKCFS